MGWLSSHYHGWLNCHSCGWLAQPSCLERCNHLPSECPPTFQLAACYWPGSLHHHLQGGRISSLVSLLCCQFFSLELVCKLFIRLSQGRQLHLYSRRFTPGQPFSWQLTLFWPPGHLDLLPKIQVPQAWLPMVLTPI